MASRTRLRGRSTTHSRWLDGKQNGCSIKFDSTPNTHQTLKLLRVDPLDYRLDYSFDESDVYYGDDVGNCFDDDDDVGDDY